VEIRRYGLEGRVTTLARKLGLPVVSTFMGRGLLDQAPDVLLGTYLGAAGDPAITKVVEEADALLLLGVIFSDTNFALSHIRSFVNSLANSFGVNEPTPGRNAIGGSSVIIESLHLGYRIRLQKWSHFS
jgi:thiamine pyrophosphate-dependent acetolactate synthase large subunit-like protein